MKTTMKKIIASILILVLTVSICPIQIAFAADTVASGECGEKLTWTLDSDGVLTISGQGEMKTNPWYYENTEIKHIVIENGVTDIVSWAFSDKKTISSVSLPDSLVSIGQYAFYNTSITSLTIPESVKTIHNDAFRDCDELKTVSVPGSVTYMGKNVFYDCDELSEVNLGAGIKYLPENAFASSDSINIIIIPEGVIEIGEKAFYNCQSLNTVSLPKSLEAIGKDAFASCSGLEYLKFSENLKIIGDNAFDCDNLITIELPDENESFVSINGVIYSSDKSTLVFCPRTINGEFIIPKGVKQIFSNAFSFCKGITSVAIPDTVTEIGDFAFRGCSALDSITIPESVNSVGSFAFSKTGYYSDEKNWVDGALYSGRVLIKVDSSVSGVFKIKEGTRVIAGSAFYYCKGITEVIFPESIIDIGREAFCYCSRLTQVDLPDGISRIDESMFYYCTSLISIKIPKSVDNIGKFAFGYCTALASVVIPQKVKNIDDNAFLRCNSLRTITIPESVTSIGESALYGLDSLTDVYFGGSAEEWRGAAPNLTLRDSVTIHYNGSLAAVNCGDNAVADVRKGGKIVISGEGTITKIDSDDPLFAEAKSLKLSDSVTAIGAGAFFDCDSLTGAVLPKSIESIGDGAFGENVKNIYFAGSESEWKAISGSDKLTGVTVHFDGKSAIGGFAADDEKLECEIYCEEGSASTAFVPVFDENGRFLRIDIVELEAGEINTFDVDSESAIKKASLIVADDGFAPICEAKEYSVA